MSGPGLGRIPVEQIFRTPPQETLLDIADLVPPAPTSPGYEGGAGGLHEAWLNGVAYKPEQSSAGASQYVNCPAGVGQTKAAQAGDAIVGTDPVLHYVEVHCSALGWESADYVGRARRALAVREAFLVEREFWAGAQAKAAIAAGVDYAPDQWLANPTATTLGAGAVNPVNALGLIHDALGSCAGGAQAMIHIPPSILDFILGEGQTLIYRDGARYLDAKGNRVVPGYGYSGVDPNGNAATAGTAWIYTSGPVRYWRTETVILPDTFAQALDRTANTISFRAERWYLVDFDRSCHFAVHVNLTDV